MFVIVGKDDVTGRTFLCDVNGKNLFTDKAEAQRECEYFNSHIVLTSYQVKRLAPLSS